MSWWEAAILGLLQGLTEFLPVSSSGHLVLGRHALGLTALEGDILFEVLVHFGTVLSIFFVYRRRIAALVVVALRDIARPGQWKRSYREDEDFFLVVQILITMIPTGLMYVLFGDRLEALFSMPRVAAGMLIVTGLLLVATLLVKDRSGGLNARKSFFTGVAQSLALIPGISRSGATICAAIYQNVEPEKAADFSFLMLLPVVLGATVLKVADAADVLTGAAWVPMILGTLVAFVSGVAAIRLVLNVVRRGRLAWFAAYCFAVGAIGLLLI